MNVLAKQRQKQKLEPFFGNQKKGKERKEKLSQQIEMIS